MGSGSPYPAAPRCHVSGSTWVGPVTDRKWVEVLARHLAKHFQDERYNYPDGGCACLGMDEGCVGCSEWWEQFLKNYDPDGLRRSS